jgi:hypothetical protein
LAKIASGALGLEDRAQFVQTIHMSSDAPPPAAFAS